MSHVSRGDRERLKYIQILFHEVLEGISAFTEYKAIRREYKISKMCSTYESSPNLSTENPINIERLMPRFLVSQHLNDCLKKERAESDDHKQNIQSTLEITNQFILAFSEEVNVTENFYKNRLCDLV